MIQNFAKEAKLPYKIANSVWCMVTVLAIVVCPDCKWTLTCRDKAYTGSSVNYESALAMPGAAGCKEWDMEYVG